MPIPLKVKKKYKYQNFKLTIKFVRGAKIRIRESLQYILEGLMTRDKELGWGYDITIVPDFSFIKRAGDGRLHLGGPVIYGSYPFAKGHYTEVDEKIHIDCEIVFDMIYYGCGDIDEVRELLKDIKYMGENLDDGYGEIQTILVEEINEDLSLSCKAKNDEERMFELWDEDLMGKSARGKTGKKIINRVMF